MVRGGWRRRAALIGAAALISAASGAAMAGLDPVLRVSQKHQTFQPGAVTLNRGESILIVNDDDDLLHHAYIASPTYSFDSGDQEPGARVTVPFPVAGSFVVLCGIHPKMKLRVTVN